MYKILGVKYLTPIEVSKRYGFTVNWLKQRRHLGKNPMYVKHKECARILYPLIETDNWFKDNLIEY